MPTKTIEAPIEELTTGSIFAQRYKIVTELGKGGMGKVYRAIDQKIDEEIAIILDVFNSAWSDNWGFVPVTPAEAHHLAKELRTIVDPNLAVIVEVDGKTAGVVLVVPDLNQAVRDLNGRLFPFGWAKLLWRIKVSKIKAGRLMIMGVKKEYRTRKYLAMAYLLSDEIYYRARDGGYRRAEFSWTLETNTAVKTMIHNIGIGLYKTYRLYEKPLSP